MSNNKVDIVCINETKLDSSINDNEVHIPNFEIIRRDPATYKWPSRWRHLHLH